MEIINRSSYLRLWKNLIANKQITTNPMLVLLMDLASMEQRKGIIKPHKMGVIVDLSLQLKVFQTSR